MAPSGEFDQRLRGNVQIISWTHVSTKAVDAAALARNSLAFVLARTIQTRKHRQ
jgi:hypothetical protein